MADHRHARFPAGRPDHPTALPGERGHIPGEVDLAGPGLARQRRRAPAPAVPAARPGAPRAPAATRRGRPGTRAGTGSAARATSPSRRSSRQKTGTIARPAGQARGQRRVVVDPQVAAEPDDARPRPSPTIPRAPVDASPANLSRDGRLPLRPPGDRAPLAGGLGRRAHLGGAPTRARRSARPAPPSYVLVMLPYPSGEPHIGHLKVYSVGDAIAHFHRRTGRRVMQPMGYDAFGLPAENHAIKTGRQPRESTDAAIAEFRRQFRRWGISIDWTREFGTHEPSYYRWTQWIFLELFKHGLAYRKEAAVNWDPVEETVLANEQVVDGRGERSGALVELRQLTQWFFAHHRLRRPPAGRPRHDRLARARQDDAAQLDRPLRGRRGRLPLRSRSASTTRSSPPAPTRCSAPRSSSWPPSTPTSCGWPRGPGQEEAVRDYVNRALAADTQERGDVLKPKTGVALGRTVTNPVNGEELPMYVADYVLMEYGTGAIMAVPAHDERDFAFAQAYGLPIRRVIERCRRRSCPTPATARWSTAAPSSTACPTARPSGEIVDWLEREGKGHASVNYRLRDWLISRQRYWGTPIPIIHCPALRSRPRARRGPARRPARRRGLQAQGPLAAGRGRGLGPRRLPGVRRPGRARDRHDGHVRRLVLVLPALLRRRQRRGRLGSPRSSTTGCRSTSTSAGSSTRSSTCSTPASSPRPSPISAISRPRSRSRSPTSSPRG